VGISPYLARLRSLVGHDYLLVPCVAVLIRDSNGRILMMQASDDGLWQTIGGAIEPDEAPRDAARREVREEVNVEVELGPVCSVLGGPDYRISYSNGDEVGVVSIVFEATITSGELAPDGDEAVALRWWSIDGLSDCPMNSFTRTLLEAVGLLSSPRVA
jgi:8-oxo-dGTP pyrophosphatase MutT (NUDIX family)